MTTAEAIAVEGLSRSFGEIDALDGVSFSIPRGIVFGFLGPNGAGKTTMIRVLLGLLEPTRGTARVLGCDVPRQAQHVRERTGALLEHAGLYERLNARQNLEFFGRIWKLPSSERAHRIRELLERMKLWDRCHEMVGNWSRGMKQKLAVARALLHQPELVFLDEPTAGLDPVAAAELRTDLAGLSRGDGVTVFLTTHNLAEAEKLCDLVGVIAGGKLRALGTPDELRSQERGKELTVRGRNFASDLVTKLQSRPEVVQVKANALELKMKLEADADVAPIIREIVTSGADVEEVVRGKGSLEEFFIELMEESQ